MFSTQSPNIEWKEHASQENGKKVMQIFHQNVQRHSVTSLETARSLANGFIWGWGGWGGLGGVCILRSPGIIAASPISLLSMGGA